MSKSRKCIGKQIIYTGTLLFPHLEECNFGTTVTTVNHTSEKRVAGYNNIRKQITKGGSKMNKEQVRKGKKGCVAAALKESTIVVAPRTDIKGIRAALDFSGLRTKENAPRIYAGSLKIDRKTSVGLDYVSEARRANAKLLRRERKTQETISRNASRKLKNETRYSTVMVEAVVIAEPKAEYAFEDEKEVFTAQEKEQIASEFLAASNC